MYLQDEDQDLQMALLAQERYDCPVCGEVLHRRKQLASHLHAHRHLFSTMCHTCCSDSLTLDALLLHMRMAHGPQIFQLPSTVTSETVSGRALVPAHAYGQNPISAIASLVNMASSQMGAVPHQSAGVLDSAAALIAASGALTVSRSAAAAVASNSMSQVMEQIFNHQARMVKCNICELLFLSKQSLAMHLASVHGLQQNKKGCGRTDGYSTSQDGYGSVKDEILPDGTGSEAHSGGAYACFDCSLQFLSHGAYTQHCLQSHGSPVAISQGNCSLCGETYDIWNALRTHYIMAHKVTSFCDNCKLGFTSLEKLKNHCETHAHDASSLSFVCDICNKGFYSQSQCSAHKRSHISEKSFSCQVCGSAFFKRGDLSKHFRTVHAPNRVFACRFCGKRGTRMDNMRSHVKSHGKHMTRDEILSMIGEVKNN